MSTMMDEIGQSLGDLLGDLGQHMLVTLFGNTSEEIRKANSALQNVKQTAIDKASVEVDRKRALEMAYMASCAYDITDDGNQLREVLACGQAPLQKSYQLAEIFWLEFEHPNTGRLEVLPSDQMSPRGFLCYSDDEIVISIKGSSDWLDWLMNFNLERLENEIAHDGFMLLASVIVKKVKPILSKIDPNQNRKIVLTGHSLGGAAAKCAAWLLKHEKPNAFAENSKFELFTFGAPDVFTQIDIHNYLMHEIDEYSFGTVGDMVASYPSDVYRTKYLLSGDYSLYKLDGSSTAHLLRVYEYVKLIFAKENVDERVIRFVMAKIRDAVHSSQNVSQDRLLQFFTPRKYPRRWFTKEHSICRYILLLSHGIHALKKCYGYCSKCKCSAYRGLGDTCTRAGCSHHYDDHLVENEA